MPYEIIFIVPFVGLIIFVIRQFVLYEKEMKAWIDHCPFKIIEKEGLQYVVPNVPQEVRQD